jgi:5-methylcytosine-specific restriction endonuclease McrA
VSSAPDPARRRRERLAEAQRGMCPTCGLPLPEGLPGTEVEVDHIIPRCRGGPDLAWNRQLLHRICNRNKGFALTDEAVALAAERGLVLRDRLPPMPRNWWGSRAQWEAELIRRRNLKIGLGT